MTRVTLISMLVAAGALLVLAGCVGGGGGPANDHATVCMFEVKPPGTYVWADGDAGVTIGKDGTVAGVTAMNDCIRKKAAAEGGATGRTEVVQTGGTVTETYTYGTPPAAAAASPASPAATGRKCRNRNVMSGGTGYYGCT